MVLSVFQAELRRKYIDLNVNPRELAKNSPANDDFHISVFLCEKMAVSVRGNNSSGSARLGPFCEMIFHRILLYPFTLTLPISKVRVLRRIPVTVISLERFSSVVSSSKTWSAARTDTISASPTTLCQ